MLLQCENLSFCYPGSKITVIDKLTFAMTTPGFNAVFGPSGVGKSSFAKILAAHHTDCADTITTTEINTILYSYNLERLPGWSSIKTHLDNITVQEKQGLKEELIDIFKVSELLGSRFSQLSMGQQNRVNLIRYLVQDFDLLILDESLANVDEKLRETIILAIKQLFPERMFLYISHNLMEVARFCHDILVFGEQSRHKGYFMIQGQDYKKESQQDKNNLDNTMLEIMNAF